jgi:hypothetical protein
MEKLKGSLLAVLVITLCIALCSCGTTKYEYDDSQGKPLSKSELDKITEEARVELLKENVFWPLSKSEAAKYIGTEQSGLECFVDAVRGTIYFVRSEYGAGQWATAGISPIFLPNGTCVCFDGELTNISAFKKALDERVESKVKALKK